MKRQYSVVRAVAFLIIFSAVSVVAETSVTQYGITWHFAGSHRVGQYANGDWWVVGPVTITSIENKYHPVDVQAQHLDGSMINPGGDATQGYDNRYPQSYREYLNAGLPNGQLVSKTNPLELPVNSSLISSVSWLLDDPGCPKPRGNNPPRPVTQTMAILTCVDAPPPEGSFRPPYCGSDKSPKYNVKQLRKDLLPKLAPVPGTPGLQMLEDAFAGPWVDHVRTWIGGQNHPEMHMPNYGREMNLLIGQASLMLLLDFDQLPGKPTKDKLLMEFVQLGIDLAGIADVGGGWPNDGGHGAGRKWPVLFAGLMLDDDHMKSVGQWNTDFQEDMDTFYIAQEHVDITQSSSWAPDKRDIPVGKVMKYETSDIGLPEWGIRHGTEPNRDNKHWSAKYRDNNNRQYPGWVLAALLMGQREAWNHEPLFDYTDRAVAVGPQQYPAGHNLHNDYRYGNIFTKGMWEAYRKSCGPVWTPDDPTDFYSPGSRK
jgi:hypothetical protein